MYGLALAVTTVPEPNGNQQGPYSIYQLLAAALPLVQLRSAAVAVMAEAVIAVGSGQVGIGSTMKSSTKTSGPYPELKTNWKTTSLPV